MVTREHPDNVTVYDLDAEQVVAALNGRAFVEVHLRKRYQCSTCGKSWSSKGRAVVHVRECIKDPAVKACAACRHDLRAMCWDWEASGCDIDARPHDKTVITHCPEWEPIRRKRP